MSGLEWTEGACLHDILARAAAGRPDVVALVSGDVSYTFAALHARVQRAAAVIDAATTPGARVAVVGENHPAWVECYYAVPSVGRVLVFGNHRLAPAELRSVLERSGASVVVGPRHELDRILDDAPVDGVQQTFDLDEWERALAGTTVGEPTAPDPGTADPSPSHPSTSGPDAPAWLIYTSGTTGRSKGATLSHANVLAAVRIANSCRIVADDEQYLLPFPLSHIAGFNVIHHHARTRPVVLMPRFDARAFVETVARHQVTAASLAATMLHSLLVLLDEEPALVPELRSLQLVAYGAAPMPVPLLRRGRELLGVDFHSGYGMTELAGNAVFLDVAGHRRGLAGDDALLLTAGRPGPGVELRLGDDGEILIRSPQVMLGYWDEPDATAATLVDGWLHTGDVGRFDAEGNLAIVDRKKDVILTGGENVSSLEVEQVLHEIAAVGEVAVIGVPDPEWGENVCAVVVPRAGATVDPDVLVATARERLAGFKVPRHVVTVDALPKNSTGKIVKQELRAWLAAHPERLGARR
jgi:acyl-CoA synthetase (AMP-forming)/AMP-acid ligase II